jgi:diguanylate cyclase (GGDEF)-like protein/PAS domain S-box-containing protein
LPKEPTETHSPALDSRWLWPAVILVLLGLFASDAVAAQNIVLLSYIWIPVLLAATFATPRQVALLASAALLLGVAAGFPAARDHYASWGYPLKLISLTVVSAVAVVIAWQRQTRDRLRRAEHDQLARREKELLLVSERWQIAAESADIGIYDRDCRTDSVFYSPGYLRTLGYEPGEWEGREDEWTARLHPEDRERVLAADAAVRKMQSEQFALEYRLRHKDGSWRWILDRGRVVERDSTGSPLRQVGTQLDITARREAEEILRRHVEQMTAGEEMLGTILEQTGVHVFMQDEEGRFLYANPALQRHLGRPIEKILGRTAREFLPNEVASRIEEFDREVLRTGTPLQAEELVPGADGRAQLFLVEKVRLRRPGQPDRLVGLRTDITERKRAETEWEELRELRRRVLVELTESIPVGTYVVVPGDDGVPRFEFVSKRLLEMLRLSEEAVKDDAMAAYRLVHPDDYPQFLRTTREAFASRSNFYWEGRLIVEGLTRWMVIESVPRELPSGKTAWNSVVTDVTASRQAEESLRHSEHRLAELNSQLVVAQEQLVMDKIQLRATLDSLLDPHLMMQPVREDRTRIVDFVLTDANPAACAHHQAARKDMIGRKLHELFPPSGAEARLHLFRQVMESGQPLILNDFVYPGDSAGAEQRFDVRAVRVGDALSYTWRDVTNRYLAARKVAASEEHYRLLADNSSDVVIHIRGESILWASPSLKTTLGYAPAEWIGRDFTEFLDPASRADLAASFASLNEGLPTVIRGRVRAKNGAWHWMENHVVRYIGGDGRPDGLVCSCRLIDDQVAAEVELERRARTDELTSLLSRGEVIERIRAMESLTPRTGTAVAILFCDLDMFKSVNDTYGHQVGDEVLKATADRIRASLRTSDDLAARFGGDEMLVVLNGVQSLDNAVLIAEKLRLRLALPLMVADHQIEVTMSIGVTLAESGENVDSIIARADRALYAAKQEGRNQVIPIAAS